jgi:hypothetical protein
MQTLIALFYLLNGTLVSYTVSEYGAFQREAHIDASRPCEAAIGNKDFIESVRKGLAEGETMRAECYRSADPMTLGQPYKSITISRQ